MRIEKINENQIKLILTQADLTERNIKLEDLSSPSEKTQGLFREIMEHAFTECNFKSENTPLMVEAVPVGMDDLMIIVTKIEGKEDDTNSFKLVSQSKEMRRFKKKPLIAFDTDKDTNSNVLIYSFNALDDVIDLSVRLSDDYDGPSALYKNESRYFLILQDDVSFDDIKTESLELVLGEYGEKHISSPLSKYYLIEHGEPILKNKAIKILAKSFVD